jgi:hypothetical protein
MSSTEWLAQIDPSSLAELIPPGFEELYESIEAGGSPLAALSAVAWAPQGLPALPRLLKWEEAKSEFAKFVCGSNDGYDDERKVANEVIKAGISALAAFIAGVIASALGLPGATAALIPVVAWFLKKLLEMGKNAFCEASGY